MPAEGVAAADERKLMHRTVGAKNGPASPADPLMNLREPLAAVEGLIVRTDSTTRYAFTAAPVVHMRANG